MKEYRQNSTSSRGTKPSNRLASGNSRSRKMLAAAAMQNKKKSGISKANRANTVHSANSQKENDQRKVNRYLSHDNRNPGADITNNPSEDKNATQSIQNSTKDKSRTLIVGRDMSRHRTGLQTSRIFKKANKMDTEVSKNSTMRDHLKEPSTQPSSKVNTTNSLIICGSESSNANNLGINPSKQSQRSARSKQRDEKKKDKNLEKAQMTNISKAADNSLSLVLNQSLADQRIEEFQIEESQVTIMQPAPKIDDVLEKIKKFHLMVEQQNDPVYHDTSKSNMLPQDLQNVADNQYCSEYAGDYQKSMQKEVWGNGNDGRLPDQQARYYNKYPSQNCLINQQEISQRMRRILIDWLVSVHMQHRLQPETLYITVNLIDRFCETKQVQRRNYQLVGITCMFIAAKYEEIYPPQIDKFSDITDAAYTVQQIKDQEIEILLNLNFDLTFPTALRFLERYSKLADCDLQVFYLASYMLELSLIEVCMNKWCPSLQASAAIFVAKKMLGRPNPWCNFMTQQTRQSERIVRACAKELCYIINIAHVKRYYRALFRKYSLQRNHGVAEMCKSLSESTNQEQRPEQPPNMEELHNLSVANQGFGYQISPYVSQRQSLDHAYIQFQQQQFWNQQQQHQQQMMYQHQQWVSQQTLAQQDTTNQRA